MRGVHLSWKLAAVGLLSGGPALAQSTPDTGAADAHFPQANFPQIIVTAEKRTQRALDIPISISVVSAADLERSGARDFDDLLLSIPGVSYSATESGLSRYSIRGISTAASSPTVGIYLDDVSLLTIGTSFSGAADPMLIDLDRIEVLKGPQGTLYGGSAMGGAIKYVTRRPELDHFDVSASAGIAAVDHGGISYNAESFANLPLLSGTLALRLGGAYRFDAGFVDNVFNGGVQVWPRSATSPPAPYEPVTYPSQSTFARDNYNQRNTTTGRISALYEPDASLTVSPTATVQRSDHGNPDEFFTNLPGVEDSNRFRQPTRDDLGVFSLEVTKSLGAVSLTSLTGYVDRMLELDRDFSLFIAELAPPLLANDSYNISVTTSRTLSQELRLASVDPRSALEWIVGAFYSHQRDDFNQLIHTFGAGDFYGSGTDIIYAGDQLTHTSQTAVFGDVTYTLAPHWDFSAGVRWFDIRQRIDAVFDGVFNGGHTEVDGKKSTNVGATPKVSISFEPDDQHMLYTSASKGFRPGGPNRFDTNSPLCAPDLARLGLIRAPSDYEPDSLWTYELGSKNEFADSRAVLDAAVFHTDWKHIQQQVTLMSCAFPFIGNVGAATVKGAELSAQSGVGPRTTVGGGVTYTQSRITESAAGVPAQVGQELLDTPRWMANAHLEYRFAQTAGWTGSVRGEYQYHGANLRQFESLAAVTYADGTLGQIPDATQVQAAYHVVNANVEFASGPTRWRVYVDNLTDAAPYLDFRRAPGFSAATTLRPRTVGVNVSTMF
jgi:iron complex outermembrane receptor protein